MHGMTWRRQVGLCAWEAWHKLAPGEMGEIMAISWGK